MRAGVRDAMLATEPSGEHWLLGEGAGSPTTNPMTSPHGNYIVFERDAHAFLLYVGAKERRGGKSPRGAAAQ